MSLGFSSGSGSFKSFIKFDARAGRMFRRKDTEKGEQSDADVTEGFQAVFDIPNIRVGWANFVAGAAPSYVMAKVSEPRPARPSEGYKEGFLLDVALPAHLGGGVHEFSSTARAVTTALSTLYDAYLAAPEAASGKLPVVKLNGTSMVESKMPNGQTTRNFQPVFAIVAWVDRPATMQGDSATPAAVPAPAPAPPATGSTQVPPPAAKPAPAPADMSFG